MRQKEDKVIDWQRIDENEFCKIYVGQVENNLFTFVCFVYSTDIYAALSGGSMA